MDHKKVIFLLGFITVLVLVVFPLTGQENTIVDASKASEKEIGFLATFVRTPFILFVFVGTITGVIFSAIIEFVVNIFCGFSNGYPNANLIWDLGWNQLIFQWYWKPSIWWHALIAIIVWSPLLKRKKQKD